MKAKTTVALCTALLLCACAGSVTPYRWHKVGMSESDIARQQRSCRAQANHDAKQGKTPQSLEQCMEEAGYYRYVTGNL